MNINIMIQTTNDPKLLEDTKNVYSLADKLYHNLAGNQDYVDNGILLNYNQHINTDGKSLCNFPNINEINLIFGLEDCKDKQRALELLEINMKTIHDALKELILNPEQ